MFRNSIFIILMILGVTFYATAQTPPNGRLFVLNEGAFGGEGTVGYIDYPAATYTEIDKIAAFGNQVKMINNHLYVVDGAGNVIVYDSLYNRVDSLTGRGVRGIYQYNNQYILITCFTPPYASIREINQIDSVIHNYDTTQIRSSREEAVVYGNKAFLSGYYGDSMVISIDFSNFSNVKVIGTGVNPYQITEMNDVVYAGCYEYDANFNTHTTLYMIDPMTDLVIDSKDFPYTDGLTAGDGIVYLKMGNGKLLKYNPINHAIDSSTYLLGAYTVEYDVTQNLLFYSRTDYTTFGSVGFIRNDTVSTLISTDISPRGFYFLANPQNPLSVYEGENSVIFSIYPNPGNSFTLKSKEVIRKINVFTSEGQSVGSWENGHSDVSGLLEGLYFIQIETDKGNYTQKWVKTSK